MPATTDAPPRIRFPELLRQHGVTPYFVSTRSGGRLSRNWCYRLANAQGAFTQVTPVQLRALADVFGCDPAELLA